MIIFVKQMEIKHWLLLKIVNFLGDIVLIYKKAFVF